MTSHPLVRRWRRITRWARLPYDLAALALWWGLRCLADRRQNRSADDG